MTRRGKEIVRRLQEIFDLRDEEFASLVASRTRNPFQTLVATIISQNTNDRNTLKAMERLRERLGEITPEAVLSLGREELEELIRPAGLYRQKAEVIRSVAERLGEGRLEEILSNDDVEEARRELMSLPGVGPKTADVLLGLWGKATLAIDRHIARIARRMGIARDDTYEGIRSALMALFEPEDYLKGHLLLIKLGRTFCRPKNPRCGECPIREFCEYGGKVTSSRA